MKLIVWVATNKVGSKCERTIEIPDEDLEGYDDAARNGFIDEWVCDEIHQLMEYGWREA